MKKKLHILILPSWYPNNEFDISGSFFREQAIALHKQNTQVGIIYPQFRSLKDIEGVFYKSYGIECYNDCGLRVYKWHTVNFFPKFKHIIKYNWIRLGMKLFKSYINKYGKPDLIHVHSLKPAGWLALKISLKYNIPFVLTEHSSSFARDLISDKDLDSLKPVVAKSSCNIAVSERLAQLLSLQFKANEWIYVPNIVNNSFLNYDIKTSLRDFTFICICSLNENKSVDLLIRAFALVSQTLPNTKLNIGGDGPERCKLEKLVNSLNLQNKVRFLGKLTREEVKLKIAESSVFVLPSKYETFGVVIIEALALGKPVISTKSGGPESTITDDVGIIVENNSAIDLAKAMIEIFSTYDDYNEDLIREYCRKNFSEQAVISKLQSIYLKVIETSRD